MGTFDDQMLNGFAVSVLCFVGATTVFLVYKTLRSAYDKAHSPSPAPSSPLSRMHSDNQLREEIRSLMSENQALADRIDSFTRTVSGAASSTSQPPTVYGVPSEHHGPVRCLSVKGATERRLARAARCTRPYDETARADSRA